MSVRVRVFVCESLSLFLYFSIVLHPLTHSHPYLHPFTWFKEKNPPVQHTTLTHSFSPLLTPVSSLHFMIQRRTLPSNKLLSQALSSDLCNSSVSTKTRYVTLYFTALYCTVLYCTVLRCTVHPHLNPLPFSSHRHSLPSSSPSLLTSSH